MDGCKISNRRLLDETRPKKVRGSLRKIPAELLQKRICWTNANKSERFVTVLPMTKNCGLRANDRMAKMGCRQEKFEECESGCAYHGITVFVTNTLMKVQHVAVSAKSVHNSCVPRTVIWTWRFVLRQT